MEKTLKVVGELKKRKGSPGSMKSRNPTEESSSESSRDMAKLPFEEKIWILVRLQEMAGGIRKPGKPQTKGVWQI
jgi:hypothetical protein